MGSQALVPLGEGLSPETRALAEALRTVFDGLHETLTRYAARMHLDKGAVSRYFSGQRVPHWDFIHNLLVESAKAQGRTPTQEVVSHLKDLHQAALAASGTDHDRIMRLQDRLSDAVDAVERAKLREEVLQQALDAALQASQRNAELEITARETAYTADRYAAELDRYRDDFDDERQQLNNTIESLRIELAEARQLHRTAEKRAQQLERQLEQAEHDVAEDSGAKHDQKTTSYRDMTRNPGQGTFDLWETYKNKTPPNTDTPDPMALVWPAALLQPLKTRALALPWAVDEPPSLGVDDSPTLDLTDDLLPLLRRDELADSSAKKSSWLRRLKTRQAPPSAEEAPPER